jgi:hypothetical protein
VIDDEAKAHGLMEKMKAAAPISDRPARQLTEK